MIRPQLKRISCWVCAVGLCVGSAVVAEPLSDQPGATGSLSLERAIALARQQDPWLEGNRHAEQALNDLSVASGSLPDPKVSVAFANLPTNTWDFDQEPMTQFKVGVTQMFPRGDQLALQRKQLQLSRAGKPFEREEREAELRRRVSWLWLEAWRTQESIALINRNRFLFEQMLEITQSSYSSAVGRTRQQDVIRAQLELTRLEDRLTQLQQQQDASLAQLSQWVGDVGEVAAQSDTGPAFRAAKPAYELPRALPQITRLAPAQLLEQQHSDWQQLASRFLEHPSVRKLEQDILASHAEADLARQRYKPEWGVNASYGYRDDDPMGNQRADFFSIGVSFDMPLFTGNRQDRQVSAAVAKVETEKTRKWLRLKTMLSEFDEARAQWQRLNERHELYKSRLLPQMHEQAEASLTAYTNDSGDFAEVMRARIAELNAEIDALAIAARRQQLVAQLNYYFAGSVADQTGESHHE
ncbi:MAG: transporter [Pseudomonadales bacterium]|jgi:outer membrane protein TolC|nr:transporter [Pseudomonadales bacterium]MEC8811849.1 TolC family protein [Pseudomonadota bacterium]TNC90511.1 MAG: transporter [Alcanivorax sp.]HAG97080.1 transporter [Gammaproteobacteria bacterium]MAQ26659.1 transporter [Pseudomonadales bacterium]|tara:strand:- start:33801 stop:35210 length:1410 start_codon:yes stop_codon:yes gene_type:complete